MKKQLNVFFITGITDDEVYIDSINDLLTDAVTGLQSIQERFLNDCLIKIAIISFGESAECVLQPTYLSEYKGYTFKCEKKNICLRLNEALQLLYTRLNRNDLMNHLGRVMPPMMIFMAETNKGNLEINNAEIDNISNNGWYKNASKCFVQINSKIEGEKAKLITRLVGDSDAIVDKATFCDRILNPKIITLGPHIEDFIVEENDKSNEPTGSLYIVGQDKSETKETHTEKNQHINTSTILVRLPKDSKELKVDESIIIKKCQLLCCDPESALDSILKIQYCGEHSTIENNPESLQDKDDPFGHTVMQRSLLEIENVGNFPLNLSILPMVSWHGIDNPVVLSANKVYIHDGLNQMKRIRGVPLTLAVNSGKNVEENGAIIRMYLHDENGNLNIEFLDIDSLNGVYVSFEPGDRRMITNFDKICIGTNPIVSFEYVCNDPWGDFGDSDIWG